MSIVNKSPSKSTQTYPINLIATDKVKHFNSNSDIQIIDFTPHLTKRRSIFGKLSNPAVLTNPEEAIPIKHINTNYNYVQQIDVKTFKAYQLPQPETVRKAVSVPKPNQSYLSVSKPIRPIELNNTVSTLRQSGSCINIDEMRDSGTQREDYFERVDLGIKPSRIKIEKRSVSCCKNRVSNMEKDYYLDKQIKNPNAAKESPKKSTYQVINIEDLRYSNVDSRTDNSQFYTPIKSNVAPKILVTPAEHNYLAVDNPLRFTSTSKKYNIMNTQSSNKRPTQASMFRSKLQIHDTKCPCCGGFYCPHCKSTVPPQFRKPTGASKYISSVSKDQQFLSILSQKQQHIYQQ